MTSVRRSLVNKHMRWQTTSNLNWQFATVVDFVNFRILVKPKSLVRAFLNIDFICHRGIQK